MHVHLNEKPYHHTSCDIPRSTPMISLDTVQEFSHMTATMAEVWIDSLPNFQPHICDDVSYIQAHHIISWLTQDNQPSMPMSEAIHMLTAKIGQFMDSHMKPGISKLQARVTLAKLIENDTLFNSPYGALIPINKDMFNFQTTGHKPPAITRR